MRQFPSCHEPLQQLWVHTIKAEDQDFFPRCLCSLCLRLANDQTSFFEGMGKPGVRQKVR